MGTSESADFLRNPTRGFSFAQSIIIHLVQTQTFYAAFRSRSRSCSFLRGVDFFVTFLRVCWMNLSSRICCLHFFKLAYFFPIQLRSYLYSYVHIHEKFSFSSRQQCPVGSAHKVTRQVRDYIVDSYQVGLSQCMPDSARSGPMACGRHEWIQSRQNVVSGPTCLPVDG